MNTAGGFLGSRLLGAAIGVSLGLLGTLQAATQTVTASFPAFTPASLTISAGDSVQWNALTGHNVAQSANAASNVYNSTGFRSGAVSAVPSFLFTFNTPGVYFYVCEAHATFNMKGVIFVVAPPSPTASPSSTPAPTLTLSPTLSGTPTATPTTTTTATASPSATPTLTGTDFSTVGLTRSDSPNPSPSFTVTAIVSATSTALAVPTVSATLTVTTTSTATVTPTPALMPASPSPTLSPAGPLAPTGAAWILAPVPVKRGSQLFLRFQGTPLESHWDIYSAAAVKVDHVDRPAGSGAGWTVDVVPGLYVARLRVLGSDGSEQHNLQWVMVLP